PVRCVDIRILRFRKVGCGCICACPWRRIRLALIPVQLDLPANASPIPFWLPCIGERSMPTDERRLLAFCLSAIRRAAFADRARRSWPDFYLLDLLLSRREQWISLDSLISFLERLQPGSDPVPVKVMGMLD